MPRWPVFDAAALTKACAKCHSEKPLDAFNVDTARRSGRYHTCRECFSEYMADRWRNNSDHREKQQRRSSNLYLSIDGRARALMRGAIERRPDNFTLTFDHVVSGIKRGHCPVTGIQFDMSNGHRHLYGRFRNPYSPSLDRIDSHLPYTNENCRIVITQYNLMKGELSDAEILDICRMLVLRARR